MAFQSVFVSVSASRLSVHGFFKKAGSLLLCGFCLVQASPKGSAEIVRDIRVSGNTRVDTATVVSHLPFAKGDDVSEYELTKGLEALFATGLFADVVGSIEQGVLVLKIAENAIINRVTFEGNDKIEDTLLSEELRLRPREVYTPARVQEAANRMRQIYRIKGYFAAKVEPKIIRREQGRVDIVFEVKEGKPTRVSRISFVGNRHFSDGRLKTVILTKESRWWRFFSVDDAYEPERVSFDQEMLRQYYFDYGYLDFKVESMAAELSPDQSEFFITFKVSEGDSYDLAKISVVSEVPDIPVDLMKKEIELKTGKCCSNHEVEKTADQLVYFLGERGFYFVDVVPEIVPNKTTKTADVCFRVKKTPPVYVDRVVVTGNTTTNDEVIRREFRFVEGDPLNPMKMRRSRQHLENLDFFEKVDVELQSTSVPDRKIVNAKVKEKLTGELMLSGGLSTAEGAFAEFKAGERNFRGRGQDVSLTLNVGRRSKSIGASFTEPYFLNRHLQAGVDVYRSQIRQDTRGNFKGGYRQDDLGLGLKLQYRLSEYLYQRVRYRIGSQKISHLESESPFVRGMMGNFFLSAVGHDIWYDKRDNMINPTEGYYVALNTELAGVGGNVRYVTNVVSGGYYWPLDRDHTLVLAWKSRLGIVNTLGKALRQSDRYTLGGASLRGFDDAGVGPRDKITGDSIGGRYFATSSLEFLFPLGLPKEFDVKGAAFSDWGTLWYSGEAGGPYASRVIGDKAAIRGSVGVGVRWRSPFGLIGVSVSRALVKQEGIDKVRTVRFEMGTEF